MRNDFLYIWGVYFFHFWVETTNVPGYSLDLVTIVNREGGLEVCIHCWSARTKTASEFEMFQLRMTNECSWNIMKYIYILNDLRVFPIPSLKLTAKKPLTILFCPERINLPNHQGFSGILLLYVFGGSKIVSCARTNEVLWQFKPTILAHQQPMGPHLGLDGPPVFLDEPISHIYHISGASTNQPLPLVGWFALKELETNPP